MTISLNDIIDSLHELNLLEDRREYSPDMLKRMYSLSPEESEDLHYLIQRHFSQPKNLDGIPDATIHEYLQESIHEDWDGFPSEHDKIVLYKLIDDIVLYHNALAPTKDSKQ